MRGSKAIAMCMLAGCLGGTCFAQETQAKPEKEPVSEKYYKLEFRVISRGEGGEVLGEKRYAETIASRGANDRPEEIRSGDKVPIQTSSGQYNYTDVGTNIDIQQAEYADGLFRMHLTAEVSNIVKGATDASSVPLIRRTNWGARVAVPLGKPTIVFSSDNVSDKGRTELEVTATPIK